MTRRWGCFGAGVGGFFGYAVLNLVIAIVNHGDALSQIFLDFLFGWLAILVGAGVGYLWIQQSLSKAGVDPGSRKPRPYRFVGIPLALSVCMLGYSCSSFAMPGSDSLLERFKKNRPALEKLAAMTLQDRSLTYIGDARETDPEEVSPTRKAEYMKLLRMSGFDSLIVREGGEVHFSAWGEGCTPCTDKEIGVAYLPHPPKGDVVEDLDKAISNDREGTFTLHQTIDGHWYLYFEQTD